MVLSFPGLKLRVSELIDSTASAPAATRDQALATAFAHLYEPGAAVFPADEPSPSLNSESEMSPLVAKAIGQPCPDVRLSTGASDQLGLRLLACGNHPSVVSSGVCALCRSTLCWRCLCQGEHTYAGKILCLECLQHKRIQRRAARREVVTALWSLFGLLLVLCAVGLILVFTGTGLTTQLVGALLLVLSYLLTGNLFFPSLRSFWKDYPSDNAQRSPWVWSSNVSWTSTKEIAQHI